MTTSSTMMATRVSLLILVIGLFAGMWSADSPDLRTDDQKLAARRASTPNAFRLLSRRGVTIESDRASIPSQTGELIPLPQGISAGTFLVVDQTGRTERVILNVDSFEAPSNQIMDDYVVRRGLNRWHFIRLASDPELSLDQPLTARESGLH